MISKIYKTLFFLVILNFMVFSTTNIFAYNNTWSAQSIGNFLYNKVDAPNVLKVEKYNEYITREEFAELIIGMYSVVNKIDKNSISVIENPFTDTNSLDVQRAYSLGIVKGTSKNKYSPKSNITREQIATMITRFLNLQGIDTTSQKSLNGLDNTENISKWAYDSISYCVNENIIQGFEDKLKPKAVATVEQVITMLDRMALKNNWIEESNNMYINDFYIPKDTQMKVTPYCDGLYILMYWEDRDWTEENEKIDDIEKLKKIYFLF